MKATTNISTCFRYAKSSTCEYAVATTLASWYESSIIMISLNIPKMSPISHFVSLQDRGKGYILLFLFLPFSPCIAVHCLSLYHRLPRFYRYGVLENLSKDFGKVEKVFLRKDSQKTTRRKKKGIKLRMTRVELQELLSWWWWWWWR